MKENQQEFETKSITNSVRINNKINSLVNFGLNIHVGLHMFWFEYIGRPTHKYWPTNK